MGLYAKEDIVSSSGTVIPADGLIETITLDENGTAIANTDLPFGSYYIKEIATDEHYILSDTQYPFTFEYAGQDTEIVEIKVNDGKPIENKLIYGSVSGKKIDENADTADEFNAYINKCKELALYDTGVTAEYGDNLITLSTCEYSRSNGRMVVVAKKVAE